MPANSLPIILMAMAATTSPEVQKDPAPGPVLWQNLAVGMTPEQAVPILQTVNGVKRVKSKKPKRSNPSNLLKISYNANRVQISGLPFSVLPQFKKNRLEQVSLAVKNQCGAEAATTYDALSNALLSKYPVPLFESERLSASVARKAELKSRTSGEPSGVTYGFMNKDVAVLLSFQLSLERRPAVPAGYSKLAMSLWRLSKTQYENRKRECGGTGDRRMDVVIQYMSRSAFEAMHSGILEQEREKEAKLADQL